MPHVNNKRVLKNTLFLYVRMLLGLVVSLFTARVILETLGVVDYGLNDVVGGVVSLFSFIQGSLSSSTSRFLSYELGKQNGSVISKTFSNAFFIHLVFAVMIIFLGETIGLYVVNYVLNIPESRFFACNVLWQFVLFSTFLSIIQVPMSALVISYERMNIFAYIGIFDICARLGIVFLVKFSPFDKLISLALLNAVISLLDFLIYLIYSKREFPEVACFFCGKDSVVIKKMLGFTGWSIVGSLANMLRHSGLNVLLNIFFGPVANAANAIAFRVNTAIMGFTSNFTTAVNPQITKSYAAEEYEDMKNLIFRSGKLTYYMLMLLCFPVIFECNYILHLWLGSQVPESTVVLTRLVLIISMTETFTYSIGCAVQATGNIRNYQIVVSGISLAIFPVSWVLFHLGFPLYFGLVVYLCCSIVALLARMPFVKLLLNISPMEYIKKVFCKVLLVSIVAVIVPVLIYACIDESGLRFILTTVSTTIFSSICIWFWGMDYDEKIFVKKIVFKVVRRK